MNYPITEELMREWIDNATYEELYAKWRTEPQGSPFFENEIGAYYARVMDTKRLVNSKRGE